MSTDIVIVAAGRTAVGSFNGSFGSTPAHELGATVIKGVMERAKIDGAEVDEVILGQVLTAAQGQNPARQAAMKAGVPQEKTAWSTQPGVRLRLARRGARPAADRQRRRRHHRRRRPGEHVAVAARLVPARRQSRWATPSYIDTMIKDGLMDAFHGYHMGTTAENIATKWQLSREDQDRFALGSQNKAEAAQKAGKFRDEIIAFTVAGKKGDTVVEDDEYIRHNAVIENFSKLKPAFSKDGTVTAGNASGLNDGAAAVVLMSAEEAEKRGLTPLARIASWATAGVDPARSWAPARSRPRARHSKRPAGR